MKLVSIELQNFRNYKSIHVDFDRNVTIFYGDNAQGKTNILESVYVASTAKSHKAAMDRDLIRFGEEESHIKMILDDDGKKDRVDIHIKKKGNKGIALNGIPLRRASELFGIINVVIFSPEDLQMIKNGPAERRRFIDMEECQINKMYLYDLIGYNKILGQRNKVLKEIEFRPDYEQLLDVMDIQLSDFGKKIIEERKRFISHLNDVIKDIHHQISGEKEELIIEYEPSAESDSFYETLEREREKDKKQKTTLKGPHRDDIKFIINGIDIRSFGSQGQQRTAALSLKLAEIKIMEETTGKKPLLLLDDVLSELDSGRQNLLLKNISGIQTLISCTGLDDFIKNRFEIDRVYHVINGNILEKSINK